MGLGVPSGVCGPVEEACAPASMPTAAETCRHPPHPFLVRCRSPSCCCVTTPNHLDPAPPHPTRAPPRPAPPRPMLHPPCPPHAALSKRTFPRPSTLQMVELGYRDAPPAGQDVALVYVKVWDGAAG